LPMIPNQFPKKQKDFGDE
jgi:hypothetical protein